MIRFLFNGILRDQNRSLLPVIVVSLGVALTVLLKCWISGILGESVELNASFNTGHLKVTTRAYSREEAQMPNELALTGTGELVAGLRKDYPGLEWVERIRFGGLVDFPDSAGETRAQGPVVGWGIDLLSPGSGEAGRFNLEKALTSGTLPRKAGDALITGEFASRFHIRQGDVFTLFSSSMDGGMAFRNFRVAGTIRFGSAAVDRGAIIIDLADARQAFNMEDAAGEILGYFTGGHYDDEQASRIASGFNGKYRTDPDEYAPLMVRLKDQGGMADLLETSERMSNIFVFVFVLAMAVVLWNIGLVGGLRRYNEFGVRLALGEEKRHIYRTLIYEALLIGIIGSVVGTALGLGIAYYLQEVGLDMGTMMQNSALFFPTVVKAAVTPASFYIGFIPGVVSVVLGNALSGLAIYKRQTARLFKELEV